MTQKVADLSKNNCCSEPPPDSPCTGAGGIRQNADPLSAVLLLTPPFQHLKGTICQTDPGFTHPTANNRAPIPTTSCATSSPGAPSPRTPWSGPTEWRAGRGQRELQACYPALRA